MSTKDCLLQEINWFHSQFLAARVPEQVEVQGNAGTEGGQQQGLSTLHTIVADRHVVYRLASASAKRE